MREESQHTITYRILDPKQGIPTVKVKVHASRGEIRSLVENGFIIRRRLFSLSSTNRFRQAISEILANEETQESKAPSNCFGSHYLRHLIDKHEIFTALFELKSTLSIAQAVLGPDVRFDEITARVTDLGISSPSTPWHIHLRVVPRPLPPFFVYPHAIECLLYLDDINQNSGSLCVLPGSHLKINKVYPADDISDKPGQQEVTLQRGDCVIMHSNLWHRALAAPKTSGLRHLLIFGYVPSWMWGDERGGTRPNKDVLAEKRTHPDPWTRKLAGEFYWG